MKKADLTVKIPIRDKDGKVVGEKEVARYAGLLGLAHEDGLRKVTTTLIQIPEKENGMSAIVRAEIETRKGLFSGLGDASPGNVNRKVASHLIRMAETRAKARALRDAVNIGLVAIEELGSDMDEDEVIEDTPVEIPAGDNGGNGKGERDEPAPKFEARPDTPMTDNQRRYLFRLLAERGIGAEDAREKLHLAFGVESLAKATKYSASTLIDQIQRGELPESLAPRPEAA